MIYWEKKGGKWGEGEQEREREMRCHWGIPLSPPVFPPLLLSCPFNLPLSLSLFFLFSSPYSPISNANFLHSVIPDTWLCYFTSAFCQLCLWWSTCLLRLCLSLHRLQQACNFLMSTPLPPLLAPLSIIALQSLHVVSLFIPTGHCVVSQQHSPVQ